jgi:hypothetical protein
MQAKNGGNARKKKYFVGCGSNFRDSCLARGGISGVRVRFNDFTSFFLIDGLNAR